MVRQNKGSKTINVKVVPKSRHKGIISIEGQDYKIGLHSPPTDGKANEELIEFLADYFQVSKSSIAIVKGHTSRHKVINIQV